MSSDLRPGRDAPPTDVRRATGHPIDVAKSLAEYVLGLANKAITPQGRATVGFADPVAVADDASALDQLIAVTGRDPAALA